MSGRVTIYADFHNADANGRVRLNCRGTLDDLAEQTLHLNEGLEVTLSDGELSTCGTVVFSEAEGIWVAVIDWDTLTP